MTTTMITDMPSKGRVAILTYLGLGGIVYLLMMIAGFVMRASQGNIFTIPPDLFYQIMTAHGAGVVGTSGLAASAVLWYFLRRYVDLNPVFLWINLALFLTGVVFIFGGIFYGGFAGAWTFLFPLPSHSLGVWSTGAAASFLGGLLLIGVGFLLFYLDVAIAILKKYGSIPNALGWPQLFSNSQAPMPPATVVASTMVFIVNIIGIVAGAVVLVLMLLNLYIPELDVDPLLAKNLTYFFGHVFINATIYQAVIAVYELLPRYTNRPWKVNKVFLAAWSVSCLMVMAVYPHHLLMDFAMPKWMLIAGQVLSYVNGIPLIVVTAYGALMIVYRSGIKWDACSSLLFLSMFGWSAGVIPAIIDATINVNNVMHNTMWVPGHFHFYLLLGLLTMLFGFCYYLVAEGEYKFVDKGALFLYGIGGMGVSIMFLLSGWASVPRRWAVHLPQWFSYAQIASVFALLLIVGTLVFVSRFVFNLGQAKRA